jgi:hypothetical protein
MNRSINICGNDVPLSASVYTQILYKNTFGKNLISDLNRAGRLSDEIALKDCDNEEAEALSLEEYHEKSGEIDVIYLQILWTLVKEADSSLPAFEKWLKSIEHIDMFDVIRTVTAVITESMTVDRKNG